ncbi:DNA-directed RNA polymerase sigma-70 factor [Chitinophaga cymbidii]|uniref:DNA-directed RNA polymerase sigma-70 factor n=2 Tax=Chitinophaga cymbidii TaxID=1096750 RepID=A0A512RG27_9BACT|nr:DNA-directed RNA polymerase sigma-70 factor [Chitinophaga cymbidii]
MKATGILSPPTATITASKGYFCTMPENARLQNLLQEDERQFMETLFKTYFPLVCKAIYRLVQDMATAEDLAQEVFIKIWNRRDQLNEVYFKAYLHRAAVNMALDHIDKNKRRGGAPKEIGPDQEALSVSGPAVHLKETKARIQSAIDQLPDKCRAVFIMSRYEEMSYKEIAQALRISVKTVENQMTTALKKLRVSLKEYLE